MNNPHELARSEAEETPDNIQGFINKPESTVLRLTELLRPAAPNEIRVPACAL
jgi:hypothetical protein